MSKAFPIIKKINHFFKVSNQFEVRYLIRLPYKEKSLAATAVRDFSFQPEPGSPE